MSLATDYQAKGVKIKRIPGLDKGDKKTSHIETLFENLVGGSTPSPPPHTHTHTHTHTMTSL